MKLDIENLQSDNEKKAQIIDDLVSFAIKEPTIPLNEKCKPRIQMSMRCSDYPSALGKERGPKEAKPKIAHLIQYGFEVDVLEVLLYEIYEYIDKLFVVESQVTHFGSIKKPFVWPKLAKQKRFQRFLDKIVYFNISSQMINEYITKENIKDNIWKNEVAQEHLRFLLFLKWNKENGNYFNDNDIIGFGDTDEIPSFHNLLLMKKCHIKGTTDIGIWFTHGQKYKYKNSDFPVYGHPNTLGDPTYYLLKDAIQKSHPSRNRGKSKFYLLGGIHLTRYGYLPNMIFKDMTATESDGGSILEQLKNYSKKKMSLYEATKKIFFDDECRKKKKYFNLNENKLNKPPFMVPWIMQCNPLRYPSFLKEFPQDHRLK